MFYFEFFLKKVLKISKKFKKQMFKNILCIKKNKKFKTL